MLLSLAFLLGEICEAPRFVLEDLVNFRFSSVTRTSEDARYGLALSSHDINIPVEFHIWSQDTIPTFNTETFGGEGNFKAPKDWNWHTGIWPLSQKDRKTRFAPLSASEAHPVEILTMPMEIPSLKTSGEPDCLCLKLFQTSWAGSLTLVLNSCCTAVLLDSSGDFIYPSSPPPPPCRPLASTCILLNSSPQA